jgi:predicted outer membrane repeat protein
VVRVQGCGFVGLDGGAILVTAQGTLDVASCEFRRNRADAGGAVRIAAFGGGTASFANATFEGNTALEKGGALQVDAGVVVLRTGTLFKDNRVADGASSEYSQSIRFSGGQLRYELPAPRAHWVFIPDGSNTSTIALGAIDADYPFPCAAGVFGTSTEAHVQSSPLCQGQCPGGYYCPGATSVPQLCPVHVYCPAGSSMPTPCGEGTAGKESGLVSAAQCTACTDGFWCSAGIEIPCEKGYYADSLPPKQRISQAICLSCPAFSTTAAQGSADITQCLVECGPSSPKLDCPLPAYHHPCAAHRSATRASIRVRPTGLCTARATVCVVLLAQRAIRLA